MRIKRLIRTFAAVVIFIFTNNVTKANNKVNGLFRDVNNDTLTVSFRVNGTVACESAIEAVLTTQNGIISADWNSSTKQITVIFKSAVIKNSDLHSLLAIAGYDTSELRAKKSAYDALNASCQYTRDSETE